MNDQMQTLAMQQSNLKRYTNFLNQNNMENEHNNINELLTYIDEITNKFDSVLSELKSVRGELDSLKDKTVQAKVETAVTQVENKVSNCKIYVEAVKNTIHADIKNALNSFKNKSIQELAKVVDTVDIKAKLTSILKNVHKSINKMDKTIDTLTKLGNETHAASHHVKNTLKLVNGKDSENLKPRDFESGILSKIQSTIFKTMETFTNISKQTKTYINKIENLEKKSLEIENQKTLTMSKGENKTLTQRIKLAKEEAKKAHNQDNTIDKTFNKKER